MGRLVRRFIRVYRITVTDRLSIAKSIAIDTTTLNASSFVADVEAGVTVTGDLRGIHVESEIAALGEVTSYWNGLHIVMGAAATAILGTVSCIFINNYIEVQPTYRYSFLDVRDQGPGITVGCFAYVRVASDIANLFVLHSVTTAWSLVNNPPNGIVTANGRIAVQVGGVQRYLALFD